MQPTLRIGAEVAVAPSAPSVGTIVVLHPPRGALEQMCGPRPHAIRPGDAMCAAPVPEEDRTLNVIERVVAGPGDEIYLHSGHVHRRIEGASAFAPQPDSYIQPCSTPARQGCDFPAPITIPAGHWFLLGDNRGESDDSRWWGPVPGSWIVGAVTEVRGPRWQRLYSE